MPWILSGAHVPRMCCYAVLFGCSVVGLARAEATPVRARLLATIEEGERVVEESRALEPVRQRNRAEADRLAQAEKALQTEAASIDAEIKAYNASQKQIAEAVRQHKQRCPATLRDDKAIDACNQAGAALTERGNALETTRSEIAARREALNARIARQNAERQAFLATRREDDPKLAASAAAVQRWVSATRAFMQGPEFTALVQQAAAPGACTSLRLADSAAHFGVQGIEQLEDCLRLVAKYTE